ncbi:hypothetical protein DM02DRAFT_252160 [Periconia macrospinosa]|uniref:Uncharacterized protein n=1 Tax=Periconia macrospinosa TaxID=97972 RepID=A0A2V1D4X7_9PLEO|nr:hypothetical protein DM02DRAFT_252160 [Periconia macrospinosa]
MVVRGYSLQGYLPMWNSAVWKAIIGPIPHSALNGDSHRIGKHHMQAINDAFTERLPRDDHGGFHIGKCHRNRRSAQCSFTL